MSGALPRAPPVQKAENGPHSWQAPALRYTALLMKKLAIGCGVLLLLAAIAGGFAAYWVYDKGRQLYSQAEQYVSSFAELGKAADLDRQVTNQAAFTPPADGALTKAQVDRFIALQQQMRTSLGTRFDQIKARYEHLQKQGTQDGAQSVTEGLAALKDLAGLVLDVKKIHVEALNQQSMSVEEYRWLRDQVYAAAGVPFSSFHLAAIVEAAKSGDTAKINDALSGKADTIAADVPPASRALVEPYRAQLQEWVALAWLGL